MPTMRIAQPRTNARFGAIRPANNWVTAEAMNTADATAPATAWLVMPTTPDRNAGATEANSPVTAKPANAAMAASVNVARTSGGTASRCNPMLPVRSDVSGTTRTAAAASTTNPMCTMKVR